MSDRPNGKIEQAIDAAQREPQIGIAPIPLADAALELSADGILRFAQPDDAAIASRPRLLLWDHELGAFRGVVLPPGTAWELHPRQEQPRIWTPGQVQ